MTHEGELREAPHEPGAAADPRAALRSVRPTAAGLPCSPRPNRGLQARRQPQPATPLATCYHQTAAAANPASSPRSERNVSSSMFQATTTRSLAVSSQYASAVQQPRMPAAQ